MSPCRSTGNRLPCRGSSSPTGDLGPAILPRTMNLGTEYADTENVRNPVAEQDFRGTQSGGGGGPRPGRRRRAGLRGGGGGGGGA
ncbi:hypothetical protein J2T21_003610, partial [Paeniglutamicibacter psychrophenolicus]|nr:hypothetical protein [Paeniglutamicibacter psychrophenolicus]